METPSIADFLGSSSETMKSTSDEILSLLRVMLAEALNQQDRNLAAQLYETIRSISNLDEVLYITGRFQIAIDVKAIIIGHVLNNKYDCFNFVDNL